jgi:hypothetical protein
MASSVVIFDIINITVGVMGLERWFGVSKLNKMIHVKAGIQIVLPCMHNTHTHTHTHKPATVNVLHIRKTDN